MLHFFSDTIKIMDGTIQVWNSLSSKFNTTINTKDIDPAAADNILIAWPPILHTIYRFFPSPLGLRALDYGCGTGGFCNKLSDIGCNVCGIDIAENMIRLAKINSPKSISYQMGDYHVINSKFSLITSIMALQFVSPIEEVLLKFSDALEDKGLLIFAVFNPEWVTACLLRKKEFCDFDNMRNPTKGYIDFGQNLRIPVYIRTAHDYDAIAQKYGFKKVMEEYPPFTKEFLDKYPSDAPTDVSEYLILGYRKVV